MSFCFDTLALAIVLKSLVLDKTCYFQRAIKNRMGELTNIDLEKVCSWLYLHSVGLENEV